MDGWANGKERKEESSRVRCFAFLCCLAAHFTGLKGQRFNFDGETESIYTLVEDVNLDIRAKFSTAYATSASFDYQLNLAIPVKAKGTWISSLGISVAEDDSEYPGKGWGISSGKRDTVAVRCASSNLEEVALTCPQGQGLCLESGSVEVWLG